ncbi:hypothetical protein OC861_000356 [Tilletia horrida]|nr:hypothetical protein OC861_000356 [Tilletia horrida]
MRVLFICTAFNSLSQRLALVLREHGHAVTVELALSPELMISAAELAQPDIVVCPFLTKRVPREVYTRWLTLIVHPGPPHDAGPSALDFCLMGDDGTFEDAETQLAHLDQLHGTQNAAPNTRSHWGVTVLQAIEQFDAGPIWAWDQFPLDAETRAMTKSDIYRGPVTRAAVNGVLAAIERITAASKPIGSFSVDLLPPADARELCVSSKLPFQGGTTRDRPLLKASSRDFYPLAMAAESNGRRLSAEVIVQRINCGDSQPGVLSGLFGAPLFLYDACVQKADLPPQLADLAIQSPIGTILATREGAVLVNVGADSPIWIAHVRKPKAKTDRYLAPKLPAVQGLMSIPVLAEKTGIRDIAPWALHDTFSNGLTRPWARQVGTYQQVWVDLDSLATDVVVGYVYFEFYNGATATEQCKILVQAIEWTLRQPNLKAIVLMGGSGYFSNGIALNVIEGAEDPSAESWYNINAIDDCVRAVLAPSGILTFASVRANCAAGGLALATACDVVLCANSAVLNPHYRGLGLYGSEYHTYSWYERCGPERAAEFAKTMLPMSSTEARKIGLVDIVLGQGTEGPAEVERLTKTVVSKIMQSSTKDVEQDRQLLDAGAPWTKPLLRSVSPASNHVSEPVYARYLACKQTYLTCLFASRAKDLSAVQGPTSFADGFAAFRKAELDNMVLDFFHPIRGERYASRRLAFVRKLAAGKTPARFALHRRFGSEWAQASANAQPQEQDEEELDSFDGLGDVPSAVAFAKLEDVLRTKTQVPRGDSYVTMSEMPELEAPSNGPSPPETPQPSSPKEAMDLADESLAVQPIVVKETLPVATMSRTASVHFVSPPSMGGASTPESAPRTAKVARNPNRRSSRSFSGWQFGHWGKKDADLLLQAEGEGREQVMGVMAVVPSQGDVKVKHSAAHRLFSTITRRSKASLSNLSQVFESKASAAAASTERVVRRRSMQLRRQSSTFTAADVPLPTREAHGSPTVPTNTTNNTSATVATTSTPAPPMIYACYYNSNDTPRVVAGTGGCGSSPAPAVIQPSA